ncbi:MAG: hypothetical protein PVI90_15890, partial [Desulfobacteraceae bacterium]
MTLISINTAESKLNQLSELGLKDKVSAETYDKLCAMVIQGSDLITVLRTSSCYEFSTDNHSSAINIYEALLTYLTQHCEIQDRDSILVDSIIGFAQLIEFNRKRYSIIKSYLKMGLDISIKLNDLRKQTLIYLNLGLYHYLSLSNKEADNYFSKGFEMADRLGDSNILLQTEYFRGHYNIMQGHVQHAITYFERVLFHKPFTLGLLPTRTVIFHLSIVYLNAGEFYQAINLLESSIETAQQAGAHFYVRFYRIHLCWAFLMLGEIEKAFSIINLLKRDKGNWDDYSLFTFKRLEIDYWYLRGNYELAYQLKCKTLKLEEQLGIHTTIHPLLPELLYCFKNNGFDSIPGYEYDTYIEKNIDSGCKFMQGIAWRVKARYSLQKGRNFDTIWSFFKKSEYKLENAGCRIELAKTRIEMAMFKLKNCNDTKSAQKLAVLAWSSISLYKNIPFPEELLSFVNTKNDDLEVSNPDISVYVNFLDLLNEIVPSGNQNDFLNHILIMVVHFFLADS